MEFSQKKLKFFSDILSMIVGKEIVYRIHKRPLSNQSNNVCTWSYLLSLIEHNSFSTNVPLTDKPDTWFLLAKCHSSTGVFQTFCW